MAFSLPTASRTTDARPAWSGMAVLVEAMVVLLFLIASLAIITQLFAKAAIRAQEGERLARAVAVATDAAERFAADPDEAAGTTVTDELEVVCEVVPTDTPAGTLYDATISVFVQGDTDSAQAPVYVLTTSRYEREVH